MPHCPIYSRGLLRPLFLTAAALLFVLNILCLPFYSGASLSPRFHWRLEHGRVTVRATQPFNQESFYIAMNSEGLLFTPRASYFSPGDWSLTIPLWIPIVALLGGTLLTRRTSCPAQQTSSPASVPPPSGSR